MKTAAVFIYALCSVITSGGMSPAQQCPEKCICKYSKAAVEVDCSAHKVIPESPIGTTKLNFEGQRLIALDHNTFEGKNLLNLIRLNLKNNEIQYILRNATSGLPKLEFLDLKGNQIKTVDPDSFVLSPFLRKLALSGNPNIVISDDVQFLNSDSIEFLYLNNNTLNNSNPAVFRGLKKLTYLYLNENPYINCKQFESYVKSRNISLSCDNKNSGNKNSNSVYDEETNSSTVHIVNAEIECNSPPYFIIIIVFQLINMALICWIIYQMRKNRNQCHKNILPEGQESSTEPFLQR